MPYLPNIANPDISEELAEISQWRDTSYFYVYHYDEEFDEWNLQEELISQDEIDTDWVDTSTMRLVPAYEVGYLLRKLPPNIQQYDLTIKWDLTRSLWVCGYVDGNNWEDNAMTNDIEDAIASLAVQLFERKILK